MSRLTRHQNVRIIAILMGFALSYAAMSKLTQPASFASAILSHGLVEEQLAALAAFAVGGSEALVAASLLLTAATATVRLPYAILAMAGLFAAFTLYGLLVITFGSKDSDCGCGLPQVLSGSWLQVTARNAAVGAGLSVLALIARKPASSGDEAEERSCPEDTARVPR